MTPFVPLQLIGLCAAICLGWSAAAASPLDVVATRTAFLKIIDRPRVMLDPRLSAPIDQDGVTQIAFSYAADAEQRVPGILVKSSSSTGRRPVVIALHGTNGNKESQLAFLTTLAKAGFVGIAIDGRYHGARAKNGRTDYTDAILRAYRTGREHPFFYDTVWDVMRLIDYLGTRDDVDPARIGCFGVSKGGIETYLTAAVDTRVACCVPCIGLESFKWADENDSWHSRIGTIQNAFDAAAKESGITTPDGKFVHQFYAKVAPGIDGEFDGPSMAPLICPRPMMTINGDSDARTPLPGLKLCTDAALAAYHAAGCDDRFVIRIQDKTGHKVNPDSQAAAIEWFARWLNATAPAKTN
jgi:dienelactone hydrolase